MIVILDTRSGGHHDVFLKMFARAIGTERYEVAVLSPAAHRTLQAIESDSGAICEHWCPRLPEPGRGSHGSNLWKDAADRVRELERRWGQTVDFVFFASIDDFLGHGQRRGRVDKDFPYPYSGLMLRPWMFRVGMRCRWLRRYWLDPLEPLRARTCRSVCVFDDSVGSALARNLSRPVVVFPDLASTEPPDFACPIVTEMKSRSRGRPILLLTGAVDGRKGLDRFLDLAVRSDPDDWFFVVIGRISWDTLSSAQKTKLKAFSARGDNGWLLESSGISDDAFNGLIASASALWLAYERFPFSSNLLSKAAAFRVPVISNGEYLIGERVRAFKLGLTLEMDDLESGFTEALACQISGIQASEIFQEGCKRYDRLHSPAVLQASFRDVFTHSSGVVRKRDRVGSDDADSERRVLS